MALTNNQQKFIDEINMIHRGKITLGNALKEIGAVSENYENKFNIEDLSNIAVPAILDDVEYYINNMTDSFITRTTDNGLNVVDNSYAEIEYIEGDTIVNNNNLYSTNISKIISNDGNSNSSELIINQNLKKWDGIYKNNNVLNIADAEETTEEGITYSILNNVITLNGTSLTDNCINDIEISPIESGIYTLSVFLEDENGEESEDPNGAVSEIIIYDDEYNEVLSVYATLGYYQTYEFTVEHNHIQLNIPEGATYSNFKIKLMLTEGTTVPDYFFPYPYSKSKYVKKIGSETRKYQVGDKTSDTMITDGVATVVKLDTPIYSPLDVTYKYRVWKNGTETIELDNDYVAPITSIDYIVYNKKAKADMLQTRVNNSGSCAYLFYYDTTDTNLDYIKDLDTSRVTNFTNMFYGCSKLTTIPDLDFSSGVTFTSMLEKCSKLVSINLGDTSNATNMSRLLINCSSVESVSLPSLTKCTNMNQLAYNCSKLKSITLGALSNSASMEYCFFSCTNLENINLLGTFKVNSMTYCFQYCTSLKVIPAFDVSAVPNYAYTFSGCSNLEEIHMYGMINNFNISASTKFTREALVEILNNLGTVITTRTLTMGSTNLGKLTDEDKLIATNKGWTLA